MTAKIETSYFWQYGTYSPRYFASLDDLEKFKAKEIFETNSPKHKLAMSDDDRLYWLNLYNSGKIYREIRIIDEV